MDIYFNDTESYIIQDQTNYEVKGVIKERCEKYLCISEELKQPKRQFHMREEGTDG